jgi:hypothetical protein
MQNWLRKRSTDKKGGPEMNDYQSRVQNERKEVSERLEKLDRYLHSAESHFMEPTDRSLLLHQSVVMAEYVNILDKRINRF